AKPRGPRKATFIIRADMDWQDTTVELAKGEKATIEITGTWSNGQQYKPPQNSGKEKKRKATAKAIYRGPEKLPVELKIAGTVIGKAGATRTFTSPTGGTLFVRMLNWEEYKAKYSPEGTLTVKIGVE
ncbi:MAG: hypothetical protein JXR97_09975, partial [Planctomycetes bacterium]|nr:hypothetical protein [Planctomycetota bacterium]